MRAEADTCKQETAIIYKTRFIYTQAEMQKLAGQFRVQNRQGLKMGKLENTRLGKQEQIGKKRRVRTPGKEMRV